MEQSIWYVALGTHALQSLPQLPPVDTPVHACLCLCCLINQPAFEANDFMLVHVGLGTAPMFDVPQAPHSHT